MEWGSDMDINKIIQGVTDASALLASVNGALPAAIAAYNVLFGIWARMNPGKPESEFLAYLQTASQANVDDTAAYLKAQGYVETAPGTWTKAPQP